MNDRDIVISLVKTTLSEDPGPFQKTEESEKRETYGTLKDAGAEEKTRATSEGRVNVCRVDINEEEYSGEDICYFENSLKKEIYKTANVKNKVYLYMSDIKIDETETEAE